MNNLNSKKIRHLFKNCSSRKIKLSRRKERKQLERQRTRKIEELEQNIVNLEEEIATLEDQLCLPEIYADYEKLVKLQLKTNATRTA